MSAKDLRLLRQRLANRPFVFLPTQQAYEPTDSDTPNTFGGHWFLAGFLDEECWGESRRDAEFDEDEHHGRAERFVGPFPGHSTWYLRYVIGSISFPGALIEPDELF